MGLWNSGRKNNEHGWWRMKDLEGNIFKVDEITEGKEEEEGAPGSENISGKAQQYPFTGGSRLCAMTQKISCNVGVNYLWVG